MPQAFTGKRVLDVGSRDINGNNRYLFSGGHYLGLDGTDGPNVDVPCRLSQTDIPDGFFDFVISTEMLEHDPDWQQSVATMVRVLAPGGFLLITCATTGRPEHGIEEYVAAGKPPYYRNIEVQELLDAIGSSMEPLHCQVMGGHCDLYYFGWRAP